MFEIISSVDNAPDVFLGQYGGQVAYFSAKRIINADFLFGYVFVEKSQTAQSAGAAADSQNE
jgi:hypothetical protein